MLSEGSRLIKFSGWPLRRNALSTLVEADLALIRSSGFFDARFYISRNPDLRGKSPKKLLLHYYHLGGLEGRAPSPAFDSAWYLEQNTDVAQSRANPLVHYLKTGKREGRAPNKGIGNEPGDAALIDDFETIEQSKTFDDNFYRTNNPDVRGISSLAHYCRIGWKEGRNPNSAFNTTYYLEKYPDIAASGRNPFAHWLRSGRFEGRTINQLQISLQQPGAPRYPSVIFITHEASRTGAPAVLLSLMRWIKQHTEIRFSIVIGHPGPRNAEFEKIAPCFRMDAHYPEGLDAALQRFCGNHVQLVYCNTIVSGLYAKALRFTNATFVTHVHEMEGVFRIYESIFEELKTYCNTYIAVTSQSVEALQARTIKANVDIHLVRPFIEPERPNAPAIDLPGRKKRIFGCGTIEDRKGFDLFCDVGAELRRRGRTDVSLYWIGGASPNGPDPEAEIRKRGIAGIVEWLGLKDDARSYFKTGSLFLLTSREDAFPLVCLEAADAQLPILCFDERAGGMARFVEEDAGVVVDYLDTVSMAAEASRLLDDEPTRAALGRRAKQKVAERHYVGVAAGQILELLPTIVNSSANNELESYAELIDAADAVSFDVFDTLVTRRVSTPRVIFDLVEYEHTALEPAATPFFEDRMSTAGAVLSRFGGSLDDIGIDAIYKDMPFVTSPAVEKRIELAMCIPHPLGARLFKHAKATGKRIFIASDMYLDQETIEAMLRKCGVDGWDALFLSSTLGRKKETGRLYETLIEHAKEKGIKASRILHIGDNWKSDTLQAKSSGLMAARFFPLQESRHELIDLEGQSLSQIGRIWNGFCVQAVRLWHEAHPAIAEDFFAKLGFQLTGPLASMMAMHVREQADVIGAKTIVFMARDGRVLKKAFEAIYAREVAAGAYETQYLHLARATVVPATLQNPLSPNDIYYLVEGIHLAQKPIGYYLAKAGLDVEDDEVREAVCDLFPSVQFKPNWRDLSALSKLLRRLAPRIYAANAEARTAMKTYLDQSDITNKDKVVVVDVGWLLNIQSRLEMFLRNSGSNCRIFGCYVGSRERTSKSSAHSSLLFNGGDPVVFASVVEANTTLFELLFSAPEAAAVGFRHAPNGGQVDVVFKPLPIPLSAEHKAAQSIQFGAEEFFAAFVPALRSFFPEQLSKDYFFHIFEKLVSSDDDRVRAQLGDFEVRLGGHHEFVSREPLVKGNSQFDYTIAPKVEYFDPIYFGRASPLRVIIITSAGLDNGSTRYRALNLAESLSSKGFHSAVLHAGTKPADVADLFAAADAIVFQRCFAAQGNVEALHALARKLNKRCIAEIDDLVFPDFVKTVGSVTGGEWKLAEAVLVANSYEEMIAQCDAVIVSTQPLADYISAAYGLPAVVSHNAISERYLCSKSDNERSNVRLLYSSGTYSHREDFATIEPLLYDFLKRHRNVTLTLMGATTTSERILALDNVSSYPIFAYEAMLAIIARHDLMIVPLNDNPFNRAKSTVKFVECGAVGVPVLASRVGEYAKTVIDGRNGWLASNPVEWASRLEAATRSPGQLRCLGQVAEADVRRAYTTTSLDPAVIEAIFCTS